MLLVKKNKATTTRGTRQTMWFTALNTTTGSFLLELTSNGTNETKYIASGTTWFLSAPRFVYFNFYPGTVETTDPTPTYNLSGPKYPEGYYSYNIYLQATPFNLDPTGLTVVNSGLAFLQDEDGPFTEDTYVSNANTTNGFTYYTE